MLPGNDCKVRAAVVKGVPEGRVLVWLPRLVIMVVVVVVMMMMIV